MTIESICKAIQNYIKREEIIIPDSPTEEDWQRISLHVKRMFSDKFSPPYSYKGTLRVKGSKLKVSATVI